MNLLEEVHRSGKKGRDLNDWLANRIIQEKPSSEDFLAAVNGGNDSERGTCVEALEFVSQTQPALALPYIATVINSLSDKAPRVKWEAARVIGNIAASFPQQAADATAPLMTNTTDKGTVVRWSTAFALTEIAKHNPDARAALVTEIDRILLKEDNSGVRNVYLKALKAINK